MRRLIFFFLLSSSSSGEELSFMSYNVENLFDTIHDKSFNDWQFLPRSWKAKKKNCKKLRSPRYRKSCLKSDWTPLKLKIKIEQIKRVVLSYDDALPDFLALSEVENKNVLEKLAKSLGYDGFIISNGEDRRGIDLALLYKKKKGPRLKSVQEHTVRYKKKKTRPILEASFTYKKKELTIFVNHWPSQGNSTSFRLRAATTLKLRIKSLSEENPKRLIMAIGDFNTISTEHPHPFSSVLLKGSGLIDVHRRFMKSSSISKREKRKMSLGSYFYPPQMSWNLLDRIFVSSNLMDEKGVEVKLESYQIFSPPFLRGVYEYARKESPHYGSRVLGIPHKYRFSAKKSQKAGFSDHFPIVVKLEGL